ncbi:hypothetical protein [Actinoplanes sp. NPDC051494]|uniref:hypothetical protein n=1 Tax=Actinoplanes sp. NPDC051494 TaxID=3363907 RepID=UPI0037BCC7B4
MVRTGLIIKTAVDDYTRGLEVDVVHHGTRVIDGTGLPTVWFTGWTPLLVLQRHSSEWVASAFVVAEAGLVLASAAPA